MHKLVKVLRRYRVVFGSLRAPLLLLRRVIWFRKGGLIQARRSALAHPPQLRFGSTDEDAYFQIFGQTEYALDYVDDPTWIIDAGANVGLASLYFSERFPSAHILAIEPDRSNFDLLVQNVSPYPRIKAVHAALWPTAGSVRLVDPGLGDWGFRVDSPGGELGEGGLDRMTEPTPGARADEVTAITVLDAMTLLGTDWVDVLKVDIEGAEREVFGDPDLWIGQVDSVIIELHDRCRPGCSDAFYSAVADFTIRSSRGENIYVARPHEEDPISVTA